MAHDPRELDDAFLAFWRERHISTLTTARLYHEQCGEDAASILLQMIEGKTEGQPLRQIKLGYTILRRESL